MNATLQDVILVTKPIPLTELEAIAQQRFGDMIKAVVDVEKNIMAIGGDLHADEEAVLLQNGSRQEDLWGINLYVDLPMPDTVEYDSMINIRPKQNNRSRLVEDLKVRQQILEIISRLIII